ncbi:hypothetical protein MAA_00360 [Metarhizium robertsii ARSEF 23]|uniref:MULE transposase domain-containing protein n=1 Tax=Metarhizium robertsii (strain ARSEF 23 / ATCC MYA-3075) TaxID=655844 RepID=E9EMU2_METRA|nr:uncharacterized protein MAA_00360 [Metarhizium robertsii ARSEF 23]EFZ03286.2 hypothetical protein MAA_00360 [Metarhizium robertsii ARSEF 23]
MPTVTPTIRLGSQFFHEHSRQVFRLCLGSQFFYEHSRQVFRFSSAQGALERQSIDSYKALLTVAREYKTQGLAYSDARRLLKEEAAGLVIKKRDYYNLVRLCPQDIKDDDDTITALLRALEDRAFKYRLRTEDTIEDGVVIARKLVQIFFYCEQAVPFTQRFTSNAVLIVDGTFRTNKLKFPLLVAVGKTNTNRTMPVAFSYAPSESAESFVFFFDCMRTEFYYNDICEPAVVIADHSSGMISAYDTHKALPQSRLQICSWHAVRNTVAQYHCKKSILQSKVEFVVLLL